jgi:hypothetical protein
MGRDNLPFSFYPSFSDAELEKRFSYFVKYSNSSGPGFGWMIQLAASVQFPTVDRDFTLHYHLHTGCVVH